MNSEKIIKVVLWSFILIVPMVTAFFWQVNFSLSTTIDSGKWGTFGDFFGGVLGSFWALCGVGLFYVALKEQRADFKTNQKALIAQVEALNLQTKEFEAQRDELQLTRDIFNEQAKTLKQQRLESTYFSLLNLYNKMKADLNAGSEEPGYFKGLKNELFAAEVINKLPLENHNRSKEIYLNIFYKYKDELAQYFRLVYRIIKFIDDSTISDSEKFRYIKILRSQLSEPEMVALNYNSLTDYGKNSYQLILRYNLLKHFTCTSKIEFSMHFDSVNNTHVVANIHRLNEWVTSFVEEFLIDFEGREKQDGFVEHKVSRHIPFYDASIMGLYSEYSNQLEITIPQINTSGMLPTLGMCIDDFTQYFKNFLYDSFFFSRYIDINERLDFVKDSMDDNSLVFKVEGKRKLEFTTDME